MREITNPPAIVAQAEADALDAIAVRVNEREKKNRRGQLDHVKKQAADVLAARQRAKRGEWGPWCEKAELSVWTAGCYQRFGELLVNQQFLSLSDDEQWAEWQRINGNSPAAEGYPPGDPTPEPHVCPWCHEEVGGADHECPVSPNRPAPAAESYLDGQIDEAAARRDFEEAARLRDVQSRDYSPRPLPMAPTAESVAPRSGGGKVGKPGDYITLDEWATYSPERRQRFWEILREAPSRSAALNFQEGGSIEWALWSWNPVTGCLHNCPYCYARDIANRIYEPAFTPALWPARLDAPHNVKVPHDKIAAETDTARKLGLGNVFTCSMADLFGRWVPSEWIDAVLSVVRDCPQWNFLFLTKFPQRMADFRFPDNAWVGTTVDQQARVANAERAFRKIEAKVKWLSLEPLIEPLEFSDIGAFDWVVIGGASSSTQTPEWKPPRSWVNAIEDAAEKAGVMVYEKPNLLYTRRSYPGLEMIEPAEAPTALRYLPEAKWPAPG